MEDKGVHTFPKGICPKENVIAGLEFELVYYDSAIHRFNHYTTGTTPSISKIDQLVNYSYSIGILNPYLPDPSTRTGYDTRSIFKRSLTGLNSEYSFSKTSCLTKATEEPSLPYLPIAGGRIIGFIPFPRVLVLCEM